MNENETTSRLAIVDAGAVAAVLHASFPPGSEAVLVPLIRRLSDGSPVSLVQLASGLGWPVDRVRSVLAMIPTIEYEGEAIVGAVLSLRETPHTIDIEGRRLFTWCAFDALFVPAILGKIARVTSPCGATGKAVRLEVGPERLLDVDPPGAAMSIVVETCGGLGLRRSFCDRARFFVSAEAGTEWREVRGAVLGVEAAFALGADVARRVGWQS